MIPQFDSGIGRITEGPSTEAFEKKLKGVLGAKHVVACSNGTAAIYLALKAVGVDKGEEVQVPALTFIATAEAVSFLGATPRFVDVSTDDFCVDGNGINGDDWLVSVHLNGRDGGPGTVMDCAQALGARKYPHGTGTLSFHASKIVTTGEGGAVFTDSEEVAERVRMLKNHGRLDKKDFHPTLGFNFKFDDMRASLGLSQLDMLQSRRSHALDLRRWYSKELPDLVFGKPDEVLCWQDVLVDDREKVMKALAESGIGCRPYYKVLTMQPPYLTMERFPNSEFASNHGLWLPSSPNLTRGQVGRICDVIRGAVK